MQNEAITGLGKLTTTKVTAVLILLLLDGSDF
jgi:hypothetical protein